MSTVFPRFGLQLKQQKVAHQERQEQRNCSQDQDVVPPLRTSSPSVLSLVILAALLAISCGGVVQAQNALPQAAARTNMVKAAQGSALDGENISVSVNLGNAELGVPYNATISVRGGSPPYQFSYTGTLPAGLSLNPSSGSISGTARVAGNFKFTVEVTDLPRADHGGRRFYFDVTDSAQVSVAILPANVTLAGGGEQQFTATVTNASNPAVTWSASTGTISALGFFTAPVVSTNTSATVTATSIIDTSARASAVITVTAVQPLSITTLSVPAPTPSAYYTTTLAAQGGKTPYIWALVSGTLPTGISLSSNGIISGTTSQNGSFSFLVQVTDSSLPPQTASVALNMVAAPPQAAQVNALFPPMGSGNHLWSDFNTYVLTNPLVDGVNPALDWGKVETSEGVYDFSTFDTQIQHFIDFGKKINLIVRPVANGGVNTITPAYVFTQTWADSLGVPKQDVVTCTGYPGNGQPNTGMPIVYELPFNAAYRSFIAAVVAHYANNRNIGYIRIGLAEGGEVFPWCHSTIPGYSETIWVNYLAEMNAYISSLHPTMQVMAALNQVVEHGTRNMAYPDFEAANALANGQGIGSQGWQQSDLTNYNAGLPCTSDWCKLFDRYTGQVPLELQQAGPSLANGGTVTGSISDLIPFAMAHHTTIYEIYAEDLLTALDPAWPSYAQYGAAYRQALTSAHRGK
jgi:hypothetical protein